MTSYTNWLYGAEYCFGNFCKVVIYGKASWPSYSYWMVPGTITDDEASL